MRMNKRGSGLGLWALFSLAALAGTMLAALAAVVLGIIYFTGNHNKTIMIAGLICAGIFVLCLLAFIGLKS